jgi:hypothetical protein
MEHSKDCDFLKCIIELNKGSFKIGKGEISGYIDISKYKISFDDGWNTYPDIDFIFCPICGTKLKDK